MASTILLVEDDYALAMGTEYVLKAEGYEVMHASNLASAREMVGQQPDLILLDVMLPDGSGFELCQEVRNSDQHMPIIFLTAVGEEANIVQGLELGADDYVMKPYRVKELVSRIAANIRRASLLKDKPTEDAYCFGTHKFLINEFRLLNNNQPVECTPSELRLLKELVQNEGMILTRNQLMQRLFDNDEAFVDDNTLSVYMKRLRTKLEQDAEWIETVRGVGYRFRKR